SGVAVVAYLRALALASPAQLSAATGRTPCIVHSHRRRSRRRTEGARAMGAESGGAQLHDEATRGAALSAAEQERLDAWYAAQDAAEQTLLSEPAPSPTVAALRAQIAAAAAQLQVVAQRVHELAAQNAALREETAALQHQLARRAASRVG